MKRLIRISAQILSLGILLLGNGCATTGTGKIKLPSYTDHVLKNGLKVILIEDHSLPYVSAGLLVGVGSSHDPLGKSGLANLTADALERGSEKRNATQIADAFGELGASFSSSVDYDYTYLATSGLSETQDQLLQLFFDTVTQPTFSAAEVNRLRSETLATIKRSYDDPRSVAGRFFNQMLFGSHPYGRSNVGSLRDVQSIRPKDVIRNYLQNYRPNNSTLVLVGDIHPDALTKIEASISNWQFRPIENEKMPALANHSAMKILLATRSDLKQSEIRMGHYGVKRNIADYQVLGVTDVILSEGFGSRLMHEIREKRGLTYGIGSNFDARMEQGSFVIYTNTRNEKVGEVVNETMRALREFYEKGVTKQEVEEAKGYLRGAFPRHIETPAQLVQTLVTLRFYGVGDDYLTNYIKTLNAITVDDVNAAIKKYYHPDLLQIMVYGPKEPVIEGLRPIGAVEVKDYKELL